MFRPTKNLSGWFYIVKPSGSIVRVYSITRTNLTILYPNYISLRVVYSLMVIDLVRIFLIFTEFKIDPQSPVYNIIIIVYIPKLSILKSAFYRADAI